MQCKFKVGDKVIITDTNFDLGGKCEYEGAVGVIVKIDPKYHHPYAVRTNAYNNGEHNLWSNVKAYVPNEKIVITTDGKTTKATLYHDDMKTVATARCAPEDEFDFNVGAKLAMERLMKAVTPVVYCGFKVGDRVNYKGINGTVICISEWSHDNDCAIGVEFDICVGVGHNCGGITLLDGTTGTKATSSWMRPRELSHGEAPKYYNGKIVCVEVGINQGLYTLGKIYEFVDGTFICDTGEEVDTWNGYEKFTSFDDWKKFSSAKWLEIKE